MRKTKPWYGPSIHLIPSITTNCKELTCQKDPITRRSAGDDRGGERRRGQEKHPSICGAKFGTKPNQTEAAL